MISVVVLIISVVQKGGHISVRIRKGEAVAVVFDGPYNLTVMDQIIDLDSVVVFNGIQFAISEIGGLDRSLAAHAALDCWVGDDVGEFHGDIQYFSFWFGALRHATEKALNHDLIFRKHYFNLFSFIFAAPKKTQNKTLMTSAGSALSGIGVLRGAVIAQRSPQKFQTTQRTIRFS